jgi:DNA polymerase I-like protein with 3'-5' exonuclease and polymerase domains
MRLWLKKLTEMANSFQIKIHVVFNVTGSHTGRRSSAATAHKLAPSPTAQLR